MATTVETFANQPSTTVSSGGTTAPASGTSESWTVASSASFPGANSGATPPTQFHVADTASGKTGEIIAVTSVSGTTWTVTRGAENTTTVAHTAGFTIVQVVSAGALGSLLASASNLSDVASATSARTNLGLSAAATASLPLSIANGGTGQPAQQAALDALAGSQASGQYLRGNGTHVAMSAIQAADLPAATTGTQGAVILDGTAADIQPAGVAAAGAKGQAADAKHVHPYQPWQFLPETSGAKGDGQVFGDVSVTLNSAVISTVGLSAPSAPAVSNSGTGGTILAGTYQVEVTFVNKYGETLASAATSTTTSGSTSVITIRTPTGTGNATGWYAYVTQAGGSTFTRQQAPGSPTPIGTNLVLTAPPTNTGANPPGSNTSQSTFAAGDAGKNIMIHGANGTASGPLITTILSFQSSTQVTLSANATATVSNCPTVFGTDDTAAVKAAVAAAGSYAIANSYFAEVVFAAKIYILASGPTQAGDGANIPTFNTQVPLPYPAPNGTSQKLVIALTGAGDCGYTQFWMSTTPGVAGTALVSMVTHGQSIDPTFGQQSVVGGPTGGAGFVSNQGQAFANVKVAVKGIGIWLSVYTNIIAWDFGFISAARAQQSGAYIFAPTGVNGGVQPYLSNITAGAFTGSLGVGWIFPVNQNNDDSVADDIIAEGYETGFRLFDHFTGGRMCAIYSDAAVAIQRGGGIGHIITIANMSAEVYNGGLTTNGSGPQLCAIDINWSAECGSVTYDVNDTGNYLRGRLTFEDPADTGRGLTINGAGNLKIVNNTFGPGHAASPPAVPASTGTQQNTLWRDASIVLHTGVGVTVSAISIDGTSTGLTMAASSSLALPLLPAGKNITLTYAGGTPTWDWWLA